MLLVFISTLLKIGVFLGLVGAIAPLLVLAERRQSAMFQDRIGPVRAGIPLPMELWNLIWPAGAALIVAGWLMDATLTPAFLVFGPHYDIELASASAVYSWVPVIGPFLQFFLLENPWYYQLIVFVSGLTQVGGVAVLFTGLTFRDKISVAEFVKGPASQGAGAFGRAALGYAAWAALALIVHLALGGDAARMEDVGVFLAAPLADAAAALDSIFSFAWKVSLGAGVLLAGGAVWAFGQNLKHPSFGVRALLHFLGVGAFTAFVAMVVFMASDAEGTLVRLSAAPDHVPLGTAYYEWSIVIALLLGGMHVLLEVVIRNTVDKRGHFVAFGGLHTIVDVIKTVFKEDFVPPRADKFLHSAAPILATIPAFATFAVIPFAPDLHWGPEGDGFRWLWTIVSDGVTPAGTTIPMQIANINVGILYIFAIAGTGIVGAAIAGYSSDNKYSLLGGLRAASQMVSYEVTLGLTLVGCFMIYGSLLLDDMVQWQVDHVWGVFVQPLALILFFFASIAEIKRVPFDAPEGESEIVAGYMLEYSSMKFLMFMMGEFIEHIVIAGLVVTLFFGGWHIPFLHSDGFHFGFLGYDIQLEHVLVVAIGFGAFLAKMIVVLFLLLQVRWTLPRFRYDQTMQLCWKIMLPLSLANIVLTGVGVLLLEG